MFPIFSLLIVFYLTLGLLKGRKFYLATSLIIQSLFLIITTTCLFFLALKPENIDIGFLLSFLLAFGFYEQSVSILMNLIWILKNKPETEPKIRFWRITHFFLAFIFSLFSVSGFFNPILESFSFLQITVLTAMLYLTYFSLCVWDFFLLNHQSIKNLEKEFKTPLGVVRCGLNSDNFGTLVEKKRYANGIGEVFLTDAYRVEMISFKLKLPLYNGETVEDGCGWIFRIEKISGMRESLETYCLLDKIDETVHLGAESGEWLETIVAENEDWTLHIGTEDEDILGKRAENDDWFPSRFKKWLDVYHSITKAKENGFVTKIPNLCRGEKIHIHYLTALEERKEGSISTWLAVDELKKNLEDWVGL